MNNNPKPQSEELKICDLPTHTPHLELYESDVNAIIRLYDGLTIDDLRSITVKMNDKLYFRTGLLYVSMWWDDNHYNYVAEVRRNLPENQ